MVKYHYTINSNIITKSKSNQFKSGQIDRIIKFKYKQLCLSSEEYQISDGYVDRLEDIIDQFSRYKIDWCIGILISADYTRSQDNISMNVVKQVSKVDAMIVFDGSFYEKGSLEDEINRSIEENNGFFVAICEPRLVGVADVKKSRRLHFGLNIKKVLTD